MSTTGAAPEKVVPTDTQDATATIDEKRQLALGDSVGVGALSGSVDFVDTDGPAARRVLRKIDCYLLPLLAVTYLIQVRLRAFAIRPSVRLLNRGC